MSLWKDYQEMMSPLTQGRGLKGDKPVLSQRAVKGAWKPPREKDK